MTSPNKTSGKYNWQKNWGSSIAVKVTAPVFWLLITIGLITATVQQNMFANDLEENIAADADEVAYVISRYMMQLEGGQPLDLKNIVEKSIRNKYFASGQVSVGLRNIEFGEQPEDFSKYRRITRTIPYSNKLEDGDLLIAKLVLYHTPIDRIIKNERKHMLLKYGLVFFLFGLVLAGMIHMIVTKPIFELVSAIKAVSKGDMTSRLENNRIDEFGELTNLFNKMLDKLQLKQEELALAVDVAESASSAKSSFLANMSHEIRTPLTAILGFGALLKDGTLSQYQIQQHVESIIRAGNHLHQIINDILDMSKIEAGQLVIEKTEVNLPELINEISFLMKPYADEKGLNFRVKYNFPLPETISTDPTRIKQILLNLCSNAIKFTNDGNIEIALNYHRKNNEVSIDVIDTGVGMDIEEVNRLFVPFSQGDTSNTRQFGGTGLGLCICKELVANLGGDITCQSRKGIGSRFTFTLDPGEIGDDTLVHEFGDHFVEEEDDIIKIEPGSLVGKVLLAEDTLDNQKLISMYVTRTGASVEVVNNGKQAVDKALAGEFDLILMDMQMPIMGGLDATAKLRTMGYSQPIVALTANALREDQEKSLRAGLDEYLTKPVDLNRFNSVLKRYLKSSKDTYDHKSPVSNNSVDEFENDPEFLALVRQFKEELPLRISAIQDAAQHKDWVELKSLVHKLKGLGTSFGYPDLSDISAKIQSDLARETYTNIDSLVDQLLASYHSCFHENKMSSNF